MKWTLDNVWEECLAMWGWISRQWLREHKAGRREWRDASSVADLKREWVDMNRERLKLKKSNLTNDCFFCEYTLKKSPAAHNCDIFCPGAKVIRGFSCHKEGKAWYTNPREFYQWLRRLDKKRRAGR